MSYIKINFQKIGQSGPCGYLIALSPRNMRAHLEKWQTVDLKKAWPTNIH